MPNSTSSASRSDPGALTGQSTRAFDADGTEICVGDRVVYADNQRRLHATEVQSVDIDGRGHARIRLRGASWTTADRVAVVGESA